MKIISWLRVLTILALVLGGTKLRAQNAPPPTPDDQMGISPYQSYHGGDIDSINLSSAGLSTNIPLVFYSQRGSLLNVGFSMHYNSKYFSVHKFCDGSTCDFQWMGGSNVFSGVGLYVAQDQSFAIKTQQVRWPYQPPALVYTCYYSVVTPDGSSHPLGQTSGATRNSNSCQTGQFRALDGTGWRYVTDSSGLPPATDAAGTRYQISSTVSKEDVNGNQITTNSSGLVDTLGRQIPNVPNTSSPPSDTSSCPTGGTLLPITFATIWSLPGYNGGTMQIKFCYVSLAVNIPSCIDSNCSGGLTRNYTVIQSIVLLNSPNNLAWTFEYQDRNPGDPSSVKYGSLTKVTLPTGGTISYTYSTVTASWLHDLGSRWVTSRTVNANDGTGDHTWVYTWGMTAPHANKVTDPLGNDSVHTFAGTCGSAYETSNQTYQGSQSSGQLLKTVTTQYACTTDPGFGTSVSVFPTNITTTWPSGQVAQVTKSYDSGFTYSEPTGSYASKYGKEITTNDYDYGTNAAGALLRTTTKNYQFLANSNYLTYNILNPAQSVKTQDGSGNQVAYTFYNYDENTPVSSGVTQNHDAAPPNGNYRGNQTSAHSWLNGSTVATANCPAVSSGYLVSSVTFNDTGTENTTTDACLHSTTLQYSSTFFGAYATSVTNALNQTTNYNFDFNTGVVTSITDPNSQPTTYGYDIFTRLTQANHPDGGQATLTYNESAYPFNVVKTQTITSGMNLTHKVVVDGLGRVTQTQLTSDPEGTDYVDTTYDADGRKASGSNPYRTTSDPTYGITSYQYDALGRLTKTIPPDGSSTANNEATDYSAFPAVTVTDEAGHSRKSQTDALGRLINVWEDPAVLNYQTIYQYDALGNLLCAEQHGGVTGTGCSSSPSNDATSPWRVRRFGYDPLSRLLTAKNPESGTITYNYDADGEVATKVGARGITTTYSYDKVHREYQETYSDTTPTAKYGFDGVAGAVNCPPTITVTNAIGRRTAMCDGSGTTSWSYDPMGRELTEQRTIGSVTKSIYHTYNLDGSTATLTYPSGRVITYTPSAAARMLSAVDTANSINYATSALYSPAGAIMSLKNGMTGSFGGIVTTDSYDKRLQPVTISAAASQSVLNLTYNFNLGVADNGNILQITNTRSTDRSQNFSYDALNRVASAWTNGNVWGNTYVYDPWSNLYQKNAYTGKPQGENLVQQANNFNQFTGMSYDADGNLTNDGGGHAQTYDAENRVITAGGVTYAYNGDGERVKKSNGTLYWGAGPMAESDLSGNMLREYIFFDGKRVARRDISGSSDSKHYYFSDHLGSANVVTNADATTIEEESDFYPFGGERGITNLVPQNYKFTGKERDSETGNDFFDARYYSSAFGRFMTPDWSGKPTTVPYAKFGDPQTLNLYSYVENEPINKIDADGHNYNQPGQPGGKDCNAGNQSGCDMTKAAQQQAQNQADAQKPPQPAPTNPDGSPKAPPTTDSNGDPIVPGVNGWKPGPGSAGGSRDVRWGPTKPIPADPSKGEGQPNASWDPIGHWDVKTGKKGETVRVLPDGTRVDHNNNPIRYYNPSLLEQFNKWMNQHFGPAPGGVKPFPLPPLPWPVPI